MLMMTLQCLWCCLCSMMLMLTLQCLWCCLCSMMLMMILQCLWCCLCSTITMPYWRCCLTLCAACPPGTFGKDCGQRCSSQCADSLCNHVNGHCTNCPQGFKDDFCQTRESANTFTLVTQPVVVLLKSVVIRSFTQSVGTQSVVHSLSL